VTAENGTATLAVAANSTATTAVTASLANGASATTQFTAQAGAALAISALTPNLYLAAGATAEWTPQGLVLENGSPAADAEVTWTPVTNGVSAPTTASLSGNNGIVTQQLAAGPLGAGRVVPVNACLTSGNICALFNVVSVSPLTVQLAPIAGVAQNLAAGEAFAPVTLEVTDPAGDPVAGAVVTFYETLDAWTPACTAQASCAPAPLIAQQTVQIVSGADGTVNLDPIAAQGQAAGEAVRLYITAVTGSSAMENFVLEQYP
jgi:hypothetical protein